MKLPTPIRYAVRILFELHGAEGPLSIATLSDRTGITFRAIENLHATLRQHGITSATVGAKGGIVLDVPLAEISLGKLIALLDDGVEFAVCCGERANECPNQAECAMRSVWRAVSASFQQALDAVSLEAILNDYPEGALGLEKPPAKTARPEKR